MSSEWRLVWLGWLFCKLRRGNANTFLYESITSKWRRELFWFRFAVVQYAGLRTDLTDGSLFHVQRWWNFGNAFLDLDSWCYLLLRPQQRPD
jgi:hypothetical protein